MMESDTNRPKVDEPLNVVKASRQYVFTDNGEEYLDCLNGSVHIGHSHPQVVTTGQAQVGKLTTTQGFVSDLLEQFVNQLVLLLPEELSVVYMCNNGVEANDLALLLAREYTTNKDLVTFEGSYHGYLSPLLEVSPKLSDTPKDHVHVIPLPDMYRGLKSPKRENGDSENSPTVQLESSSPTNHPDSLSQSDHSQSSLLSGANSPSETSGSDEQLAEKYADLAEATIKKAKQLGRKGIAALICEPFLVVSGLHIVRHNYFERVYTAVKENGGLFIADENQTGLGRIGTHNWAFQKLGFIPDILTIGVSIGNGHPMAAVVCKRKISESMRGYFSTFGGNPVACSIGLAVLRVLKNEKLRSSANNVGRALASLFSNIKNKFSGRVGDIRGCGLIWAIEIISDNATKEPDPEFARLVVGLMRKKEKILLGLTGSHNHVILFTPPLCFTVDNSRRFVKSLDNSITDAIATLPLSSTTSSISSIVRQSSESSNDSIKMKNFSQNLKSAPESQQSVPSTSRKTGPNVSSLSPLSHSASTSVTDTNRLESDSSDVLRQSGSSGPQNSNLMPTCNPRQNNPAKRHLAVPNTISDDQDIPRKKKFEGIKPDERAAQGSPSKELSVDNESRGDYDELD